MNSFDVRDKVCVVTGASSGIGRAVARELGSRGARVLLTCRDRPSGEAAADEARAAGARSVDLLQADFTSVAEVRRLATEIRSRADRIALLVNNAGANFRRRRVTQDGIESTFAVNVVAVHELTEALLEPLRAGAPSRVVNVASGMLARIEVDDLRERARGYDPMAAYAQSKMALVLYTHHLARRTRDQGLTVISMTPGMVRTNLGRDTGGLFKVALTLVSPFLKSAETAGRRLVDLAVSPGLDRCTGEFFKKGEPVPVKDATDADAEQVWLLLQAHASTAAMGESS